MKTRNTKPKTTKPTSFLEVCIQDCAGCKRWRGSEIRPEIIDHKRTEKFVLDGLDGKPLVVFHPNNLQWARIRFR